VKRFAAAVALAGVALAAPAMAGPIPDDLLELVKQGCLSTLADADLGEAYCGCIVAEMAANMDLAEFEIAAAQMAQAHDNGLSQGESVLAQQKLADIDERCTSKVQGNP